MTSDLMKKTTVVSFRMTIKQIIALENGKKITVKMNGRTYSMKRDLQEEKTK
jgi:uncharacterized protein (DUF2147 family)